jgi:hypothetical protein
MDLQEVAYVASIIGAFGATGGVIAALWMNNRTLKEVQRDRRFRESPFLAFHGGGQRYAIEFKRRGARVGGIDPNAAEEAFPELRTKDAETVDVPIHIKIGTLVNIGAGPALNIRVYWKAEVVTIGADVFVIDELKSKEARYAQAFNQVPAVPELIQAGGDTSLTRIPTFIVVDSAKVISEVTGVLVIESQDIVGGRHVTCQEFYLATKYFDPEPSLHVANGHNVPVAGPLSLAGPSRLQDRRLRCCGGWCGCGLVRVGRPAMPVVPSRPRPTRGRCGCWRRTWGL